tara:strand:+ start:199 stop:489 length:291 start_codon:yes stop_codon:yes gene_type:complete
MSKKTDKYISEVVDNIRKDREVTKELLQDAIKWLSKDESRHREIGVVMAKYVETLQRSNEQLVKVVGLMSKKEREEGLSSDDVSQIFDMIEKQDAS